MNQKPSHVGAPGSIVIALKFSELSSYFQEVGNYAEALLNKEQLVAQRISYLKDT